MAGRRRKKIKSLAETSNRSKRALSESAEQEAGSDLPTELLEVIFSQLSLRDNIRASSVCRRWLAIAISVRKANRPPWLMYLPKSGDLYEFYDPTHRKTYCLELLKLQGCTICYANYGWLLFYKPRTQRVFFFSPYTQERIKFPKVQLTYPAVAFSAPPTSPSCVIFALNHVTPTIFEVRTCRPGDVAWKTINFENQLPFISGVWNNIVFCNGLFYCLSLTGRLGVYDPERSTWAILPVPLPLCLTSFPATSWWKGKFLAEHNGDIFVIYASHYVNPIIYKLDRASNRWREIKDLGGMTIFANFLTSHFRTDLLGKMRNTVYFPKIQFYGKRCFTYSLDSRRYHPRKEGFDHGELDLFEHVWIDAPEDLSIFL